MLKLQSRLRLIFIYANIVIGGVIVGYSLSYTSTSETALYRNFHISDQDTISRINPYLNGSFAIGAIFGILVMYRMLLKYSNRTLLLISDLVCLLSIFTLIENIECFLIFRFFLGVSCGMSGLSATVYTSGSCPLSVYYQTSMFISYAVSIGQMLGYVMCFGYINEYQHWWEFVFLIPAILSLFRAFNIISFFYYDNPFEKSARRQYDLAKRTIEQYYKPESVEEAYQIYLKRGLNHPFHFKLNHLLLKEHFVQLHVAILSTIGQIWCGQYMIFQLAPQQLNILTNSESTEKYLFMIAAIPVLTQFITIPITMRLGNKYTLLLGYLIICLLNIILAILQDHNDHNTLIGQIIIFCIYQIVYTCTLGPVGWAIVPQTTDMDGVFIAMTVRWISSSILIICFPYMQQAMNFQGCFLFFAGSNAIFAIYTKIYILDTRGYNPWETVENYKRQAQQTVVVPREELRENFNFYSQVANTNGR